MLSWDLILSPYWEGGRGLGFFLLSSSLLCSPHLTSPPPPPKAEHRLGSGDSNRCRLALPPTRSTPSGLPPFSYCLINRLRIIGSRLLVAASAAATGILWCIFPGYMIQFACSGSCSSSLLLELCLVRFRWVQPILLVSMGAVMTPMIGWSPLNYMVFVL